MVRFTHPTPLFRVRPVDQILPEIPGFSMSTDYLGMLIRIAQLDLPGPLVDPIEKELG
jgi:hypothetical protein